MFFSLSFLLVCHAPIETSSAIIHKEFIYYFDSMFFPLPLLHFLILFYVYCFCFFLFLVFSFRNQVLGWPKWGKSVEKMRVESRLGLGLLWFMLLSSIIQ